MYKPVSVIGVARRRGDFLVRACACVSDIYSVFAFENSVLVYREFWKEKFEKCRVAKRKALYYLTERPLLHNTSEYSLTSHVSNGDFESEKSETIE